MSTEQSQPEVIKRRSAEHCAGGRGWCAPVLAKINANSRCHPRWCFQRPLERLEK